VLAGGSSRHHRFTDADIARFSARLEQVAESGAGLMITSSRRTPSALKRQLADISARHRGFNWDGTGENPYIPMLALADFIVVTVDSFNMVGEAAATGASILVFEPSGGHRKLTAFVAGLSRYGAVHPFDGGLEARPYEPLDSTSTVARVIAERLARHRRALGLPVPAPVSEFP
jgi:mitochondrial fission protein ELM1